MTPIAMAVVEHARRGPRGAGGAGVSTADAVTLVAIATGFHVLFQRLESLRRSLPSGTDALDL
jgi:hypothetical protein